MVLSTLTYVMNIWTLCQPQPNVATDAVSPSSSFDLIRRRWSPFEEYLITSFYLLYIDLYDFTAVQRQHSAAVYYVQMISPLSTFDHF